MAARADEIARGDAPAGAAPHCNQLTELPKLWTNGQKQAALSGNKLPSLMLIEQDVSIKTEHSHV
jgi:hypothetical protein